ncbi:assimilatory nitrate reductase catalytic subunit NasC [Cytobacillus sp. IB215665]|uniref:assimilatory nitrate reductase catalytic subunit NasC n=1 Tax=Cytobacillus sp. IB215665 TaxID=3097357 RepID=UPI002A11192B|nr:nitrate reductase [Cytobacillus sp. IB215665]MDX8364376.1 nitrate reductase [Cytobacillus sp. IB215665]
MNDLLKHFREKQKQLNNEKIMNTQCPYCSMQCSMQLIEERIIERMKYKVVPNKMDPTSQGKLCIKGLNAHQHVINDKRITSPMLKIDGEFVKITWDMALEIIKGKFKSIQEEDGFDALSVYGGGSLTNEEAYMLGKFARVALKTRHIDYNGRFCMSSAATAANDAFGIDRGMTNPLSDIPLAKCIILAGTNIAECQPTIMPYFLKAKKNGAFIIAIDPRETATTKIADIHLQLKPGTDWSLVNGMLKVLVEEGYANKDFIENRTHGYNDLQQFLCNIQLTDIVEQTGIHEKQIRLAAEMYGKANSAMVFTARGVEQHVNGNETVRNFINLCLITGKIGREGCGYGAITGQGNGQGGREHGQKADQLPGYRSINNMEHRKHIASVWGMNEFDLPSKGVSAYEMIEKIDRKEITGLLVVGSNPVVSNPNAIFVEKSLKKLNFLVVVDMFISETAQLADLLLPSSSYLENEGTMTNLEGRITLRNGERKKPGEVKHDWEILRDIATILGEGEYFNYATSEDIFNELRVASRGGRADYAGVTYERLNNKEKLYWPCPNSDHPGTERLFSDQFAHTDGRAVIKVIATTPNREAISEDYPLYLTTGRVLAHYLSGTQTRRSSSLNSRYPESHIEIHPLAAKKFGVKDKSFVKLESKRGSVVVRCKITPKIRRDTVFVPFHWGDIQNINRITDPSFDPSCKMPSFKLCAVKISPF